MPPLHVRCLRTAATATRLAVAGLVLALPGVALAAMITWNPAQDIANALDVDTSGTLVEAINASGSGASATVNGVAFAASDALLDRSYGGDTLAGQTSGDASLDGLIGRFDYGNGTSTAVSLGSGLLVPGERYLIQLFFTDLRGCCSGRDMSFGDGLGNEVDLNATGAGLGQFAVGWFDADATSQSLTMRTNGFGNAHITGYQIRAIPEPGAGLLVLFGLTILGVRGRRAA